MSTSSIAYSKFISKEHINELPLDCYHGPIEVVTTSQAVQQAVNELRKDRWIGFDTETKPAFRKGVRYPVALLQLTGSEKTFLFRLNFINLPDSLAELMSDPNHLKIGLAVEDDLRQLRNRNDFDPKGVIDLSKVAKKLKIKNSGLRSLAAIFLGIRISKKAQVSNWAASSLTESQVLYAATDSWVCREIFKRLNDQKLIDESDFRLFT